MLNRFAQSILSTLMSLTVHRWERLNNDEVEAQKDFMAKLKIPKRKTEQSVIVALVGLVGSGKSTVVKVLAPLIGAAIVEGDEIRIGLRRKGQSYDQARLIGENATLEIVKLGGNVVMDSDHLDAKKSASLQAKAKKAGAKLVFVRIIADFDVMVGRILSAKYQDGDFFGGASSKWKGDAQSRGAVVKLREMWRRTPNHYRWMNEVGGKWLLKKLPYNLLATIDTTDEKEWPTALERLTEKITAQF